MEGGGAMDVGVGGAMYVGGRRGNGCGGEGGAMDVGVGGAMYVGEGGAMDVVGAR